MKLEGSERHSIRKFCDNIDFCYLYLSRDYAIVESNDRVAQLNGFGTKQIQGKCLLSYCEAFGLSCPLQLSEHTDEPIPSLTLTHTNCEGIVMQVQWDVMREEYDGQLTGWILTGKLMQCSGKGRQELYSQLLRNIVTHLPVAAYFKNLNGEYLFCNDYLLKLAGYKKEKEIVGRGDYDLPWADTAEELLKNDRKALVKGRHIFEEPAVLGDGRQHTMLSVKAVLHESVNSPKPIGTIGLSFDLTAFKQHKLSRQDNVFSCIQNNLNFTKREIDCINLLISGMSVSGIADKLKRSTRTIETHVSNIKYKTQCSRQFQLGYLLGQYGEAFL